jgi:hypothetical protein
MRNLLKLTTIGMAMLALAGWAIPAEATLTTFTGDCSAINCFGSTFTLSVDDLNDGNSTTYKATLTIDATNYSSNISGQVYIDAVDIKIVNTASSVDLTAAPTNLNGWNDTFNSGQAATDCGSGAGFFACAADINPNDLAPVPGLWSWTWDFVTTDAISFGHIGASFNNAEGTINGQNVSISNATTTTTTVPEPSAFLLTGVGLVMLAGAARRSAK